MTKQCAGAPEVELLEPNYAKSCFHLSVTKGPDEGSNHTAKGSVLESRMVDRGLTQESSDLCSLDLERNSVSCLLYLKYCSV